MIDITLYSALGCVVGIFVGLLPGLTNSIAMVLMYPFFMHTPPQDTVAFYICMITLTQYHGGLGSTLLGIPTESSCLPSVKEGFAAAMDGRASTALSGAAIGSFSGSFISLVLGLLVFFLGNSYFILYNYTLQSITLTIVLLVAAFTGRNKVIVSFAILGFGYFLGKIGTNGITGNQFFTFGNPYLVGGIPDMPVMVMLYSLPIVMSLQHNEIKLVRITKTIYEFVAPIGTILRSGIIGFVCGFIPMMGIVFSSNIAYSVEKWFNRVDYNTRGDIRCLVASDTGHNSGIIASLIPLFCFAIPIVPSEYILYELTTANGLSYNIEWLTHNYWWLFCAFICANIVGLITTWPMARYFVNFMASNMQHFKVTCITLLLFVMMQVGINNGQLYYFVVLSLIFLPIGWMLRKYDTSPLLVGFILSQQFDNVIQITYNLHT